MTFYGGGTAGAISEFWKGPGIVGEDEIRLYCPGQPLDADGNRYYNSYAQDSYQTTNYYIIAVHNCLEYGSSTLTFLAIHKTNGLIYYFSRSGVGTTSYVGETSTGNLGVGYISSDKVRHWVILDLSTQVWGERQSGSDFTDFGNGRVSVQTQTIRSSSSNKNFNWSYSSNIGDYTIGVSNSGTDVFSSGYRSLYNTYIYIKSNYTN